MSDPAVIGILESHAALLAMMTPEGHAALAGPTSTVPSLVAPSGTSIVDHLSVVGATLAPVTQQPALVCPFDCDACAALG